MKYSLIFCVLMRVLSLKAQELQLPANQKWDGKYFYKATRGSLPLAKKLLDEYDLHRYSHILDIGCGPGSLTAHMARRAPKAEVEGIDPNISMIKFAQGYYQNPRNLVYKQAALPSEKKWDFYFFCNGFHLLTKAQQVAALKRLAACAVSDKDVPLFMIMAAKTKEPQVFARAYTATLEMPEWESLRSINLDDYFQPHDAQSFTELAKGTGFDVQSIEVQDEFIQFENERGLIRFITSWMGGFEFVAKLREKKQKKLIKDIVVNYLEEEPFALDGSIVWTSPRLIVEAQKSKEV